MSSADRQEKINSFGEFLNDSERLFKNLLENDKYGKALHKLYTFHACPGGAMGGINDKEIEIKFGVRSIGVKRKFNSNMQIQQSSELARGASLKYDRADNGDVFCCLYPATSENMKPREEVILIGVVKNPAKLKKWVHRHWKYFISYMEVLCIDGNPTIAHRIITYYLRNCKRYYENGKLHKSRTSRILKNIVIIIVTGGLSGLLIFGTSRYLDCDNRDLANAQESVKVVNAQEPVREVTENNGIV